MGLVEKLVERGDNHPGVLIAALLGIIVVAGIGGGIWINNLNSRIEHLQSKLHEQESIQKKQLDMAEKHTLDTLKTNTRLSRKMEALKKEVKDLRDEAGKVREGLRPLAEKGRFGPHDISLLHDAFGAIGGVVNHADILVREAEWSETTLANLARN